MTVLEAIERRHSVRAYTDKKIEGEVLAALWEEVAECNAESGLNIRLVTDDDTIGGPLTKLRFKGVKNCIVLAGKESADLEEKAGYYGERLVLRAQQLGLNTCWAAMFSGKKFAAGLGSGERAVIVITLGYGVTQGEPRKTKPMEALCRARGDMPEWFYAGMRAVMLAPTAMNQQKFLFTLTGNTVRAENMGGSFSGVDLGIAKYHFEAGAGESGWSWADF